jgi:hypothetical protein
LEPGNDNIAKNGWSEYGRLVLNELQRLNQGQDDLKKDLDARFSELNLKISDIKNLEKELEELKEWKEKVVEIWSVTQMEQSKDELYKQKNKWQVISGVIIAIQVIMGLIIAFKDKLF